MTINTKSPLEWVKISISNYWGNDKLLYADRLAWVHCNLERLDEEMANADDPFMYAKAVRAYRDILAGKETGFTVALDATTSGFSIMSMMTKCERGLKLTNVIDTGYRHSVYLYIVEQLNKKLGFADQIIVGEDIEGALTYKEVKQAIMTFGYFSKAEPEALFGELIDIFKEVMVEELPGALDMMEDIRSIIRITGGTHDQYTYTLPDGHTANFRVRIDCESRIEIQEYDGKRFTHYWKENGVNARSVALGANIVQSVDAYIVRQMYDKCDLDIRTIHDSFSCHPNYVNEMHSAYLSICQELIDGDLFKDIMYQLVGDRLDYFNDNAGVGLIANGEYAIT